MGSKHQVANLELTNLDAAYDGTMQNMPLHTSFMYGKHRTKDSHEDKSQRSEEMKTERSRFGNPKKISVSSHYKIPWQKKLSKKYSEIKQRQDSNLSLGNKHLPDTFQRLQQPANRLGILDVRTDSRIKKAPSPGTDPLKVQQNSPNQHGITYKVEGNSLNSWKPIHGRRITTANPLNSGEDTLSYEGKRQDAEEEEEEEESFDNIHMHEDGEDGDDEEYGDIKSDYARKIQETGNESDGSNIGPQAIYRLKDDGVQRILNQVPYSARFKDGTRSYTRGSSSRSSKNGSDDNERTENMIHTRIENLKDRIKREMARNFY
jgi:hypothetical protein